jgi:hypothetical protein
MGLAVISPSSTRNLNSLIVMAAYAVVPIAAAAVTLHRRDA